MEINLFDDNSWLSLRPLTFTRPVADLRVGILTIAEKWAKHLSANFGYQTQNYLRVKYPSISPTLFINGSVCPDESLVAAVSVLQDGEVLCKDDVVIAFSTKDALNFVTARQLLKPIVYTANFIHIRFPEHIFGFNDVELNKDFDLLTKGRTSAKLSSTNTILGERIFVEDGATAECATFNTLQGPIYLGQNSQVWEGANVRGAFALGHNSQLKMGTKIYGKTTIGPYCRVGGEVNNAVIWGYSSKGHEGYLGNAVLGQWCNIGADSNNSNLKNNYAEVKLWDYQQAAQRSTGLQFCGLIMADHAKCAINTMFNTGTVVGVGCNVFSTGFPDVFVPDYTWGGAQGIATYRLDKMLATAEKVLERRNLTLNTVERDILSHIFELTNVYRKF